MMPEHHLHSRGVVVRATHGKGPVLARRWHLLHLPLPLPLPLLLSLLLSLPLLLLLLLLPLLLLLLLLPVGRRRLSRRRVR